MDSEDVGVHVELIVIGAEDAPGARGWSHSPGAVYTRQPLTANIQDRRATKGLSRWYLGGPS